MTHEQEYEDMAHLRWLNNNEYEPQYEYIVWIGGTPNKSFESLIDAELHAKEWIDKGYDDVVIESIIKHK